MTSSADLDAFALTLHAQRAWTPDIQQRLMDLIREPAMTTLGQIIPANDRTKAMDNLFRCKPTAWDLGVENIGLTAWARLRKWYQLPGEDAVSMHEEVTTGDLPMCTVALAITVVIARVYAELLRRIGR